MYTLQRNNMQVATTSVADIKNQNMHSFSLGASFDLDDRTFYVTEEICMGNIQDIFQAIIQINKEDERQEKLFDLDGHIYNRKPITIYVSSYGGSVYDGLALIGVMKTSVTPIHTIATGKVMSMGFAITIAGHKRYSTPYTSFMIHSVSSMAWGQSQDLEESLDEVRRIENIMFNLITEKTSITAKFLKKLNKHKRDYYFDEHKALELGVISAVV